MDEREPRHDPSPRMSRRRAARLAAGAAAGALMAGSARRAAARQAAAENRPEIALIEANLGRPLPPPLRKAVADSLASNDSDAAGKQAQAAARAFPLTNSIEPAFLFRPAALLAGEEKG